MEPAIIVVTLVGIAAASVGVVLWAKRQQDAAELVPGRRTDPLAPRRRRGPVVPLPTGDATALRDRWRGPEGRAVAVEAARWLAGMHASPPPEVGRHEGRVDLRGFRLPDPPRISAGVWIRGDRRYSRRGTFAIFGGVRWTGIDFSDAVLRGVELIGGELRDCLFDEADLDQFRGIGVTIADCSFRRADLSDVVLCTSLERSPVFATVRDSSFDDARLPFADVSGVTLERISLSATQLAGARLRGNSYVDVTFEGSFADIQVDVRPSPVWGDAAPEPRARLDLSGARDVTATGYRLDEVSPPDDGDRRR